MPTETGRFHSATGVASYSTEFPDTPLVYLLPGKTPIETPVPPFPRPEMMLEWPKRMTRGGAVR